MTEPLPYSEAMAELEGILSEIEREDVDVDMLSVRVKRAAELIRICRERIQTTKLEVDEIVTDLEPPSAPTDADVSGPERSPQ